CRPELRARAAARRRARRTEAVAGRLVEPALRRELPRRSLLRGGPLLPEDRRLLPTPGRLLLRRDAAAAHAPSPAHRVDARAAASAVCAACAPHRRWRS